MSLADKERWDQKHQNNLIPHQPIASVTRYATLAKGKEALDIACGTGRHSRYLASLGFQVQALDISSVAIAQLQNLDNIDAKEVDFDTYILPQNHYDLIVCTYFLERRLFPQMVQALKLEGILILETFLHHPQNERIPSNPTFRLKSGELRTAFEETCELLDLSEYWDKDYMGYKTMKTTMVAKKIS